MDNKTEARIGIGWWNTGLSPQGKSRANENDKTIASAIVKFLVKDLGIDCLALGEINEDDLHYFVDSCSLTDYGICKCICKEGRLKSDVGILFNKNQVEMLDPISITTNHSGQRIRIAHRIDLITRNTSELIHLFVLHWPSRQWYNPNTSKRHILGVRLHDNIAELKNDFYIPQVIIIGDFNDEPFDDPIAEHIPASRDRASAMENDLFFYNPFWRHLGESLPFVPGSPSDSFCGTYRQKSGEHRWRTFDQIIFSSSFLTEGRWYLDERHVAIFGHSALNELVRKTKSIFDHLPIMCVIKRQLDNIPTGGRL